jgi:sugar-specific transcriptional regulator TrmB
MPLVPDTPAARADARPPLSTDGLRPTDINPDEMDEIIMRIFQELRKQLSQMESKKAEQLTTTDRERHARILSNLERTMERLAAVEAGRAAQRKSAKEQDHNALFEELHNRIARAVRREIQRTSSDRAEGTGK